MSSDRTGWAPIVIGEPVAEFEPRPPRTRTYRPDTAADGWSTERFVVRAASVRGYQHRHDGAPRQDDFAVTWHPGSGAIVIAVADGVSSVELAHVGATLACRTAIDYLTRWLDEHDGEPDWLDLVRCASWALVEFAKAQLAADDPSAAAEEMLATTLVAAVVRPGENGSAVATVVEVGDSEAWVLHSDEWRRCAAPENDELVNPVVFALPRVPEQLDVREVELPAGAVLVLGTDGLGGPLGDGSGSVGDRFAESLGGVPSALELAHLLDFSRETFDDDRTLVAVWHRGEVP